MEEQTFTPLQWALPPSLEVPPDELVMRLDFFRETIMMYQIENGVITTRPVAAVDIAAAMSRELTFTSGLLPAETLWWSHTRQGDITALWRKPKLTRVAIQLEAFKPPTRFHIPMPGLVFVCPTGRTPSVFAAKTRPKTPDAMLYRTPTFNVFNTGAICLGTHRFPEDPSLIPESFFQSFFSRAGDTDNRSKKHPHNLMQLWEELDGKKRYPQDDLVHWGTVRRLMEQNPSSRWY